MRCNMTPALDADGLAATGLAGQLYAALASTPGQSVVVMVPVRAGKASATRLAGRAGKSGVQLASEASEASSRKAVSVKRGRHVAARVRVAQG